MSTKTTLLIVAGVILLLVVVWYEYSYHKIRCKIINKTKEGQPEIYYYDNVRWNKKKKKGYIFDTGHSKWKFMTLRQRAEMQSCLKNHKNPPEIHL